MLHYLNHWDAFWDLAYQHADAREPDFDYDDLSFDQYREILPCDRHYAAVMLIAQQPFFDPFYGSRP